MAIIGDSRAIEEEAERLLEALSAEKVHPLVLEAGFKEYSNASKNEVVARVARAFVPPPKGALLARLLFIRTPENETSMRTAFLANLRSPYAEARKFSLLGLKQVGHEALMDLALLSLRDDADQVLATALDLLLPAAKTNRSLWTLLQGFYATHKGQEAFHMSIGLLEAHGIASR